MKAAASILFASILASAAFGAGGTLTGTVKDPAGAPFKGAFVRLRNERNKVTISVLSDSQGRYRAQNVPPGVYEVRATAMGFKADPRPGVKIGDGSSATQDFALEKGMVRWSDLSVYQGSKLLPEGKGKDLLFGRCFACHGFQSRMASTRRDENGWLRAVNFMRDDMHYFLSPGFTDQNAADVVSYLTKTFGEDSDLPRSPADLPAYKSLVRNFGDEAMKIQYVDYELPGPNRFPWSGVPDKDGKIWMPYYGRANRIARLDPGSGEIQEFRVPNQTTAAIHSAVPAPDGTVWFSEQGANKIGRWDPKTEAITEYQAPYLPGKEGQIGRASCRERV